MKKIFISLLLLAILSPCCAYAQDDKSDSEKGVEGLLDSSSLFDNPYASQKQITDEEFDKTIERLKAKKNKKKIKKEKKQGSSFNETNDGEDIKEKADKNLILSIPTELINGDGMDIPIGHYKVVGEKKDGEVNLNLYQAHALIAKIPAIETTHDFDEMDINFVKIIPYNNERVKIIYGSMDFNAYTFIKLKNKISDSN